MIIMTLAEFQRSLIGDANIAIHGVSARSVPGHDHPFYKFEICSFPTLASEVSERGNISALLFT